MRSGAGSGGAASLSTAAWRATPSARSRPRPVLAEAQPGLGVEVDGALGEISMGSWTGRDKAECEREAAAAQNQTKTETAGNRRNQP